MYLDNTFLLQAQVGYGNPGWNGSLGYEEKTVSVQGQPYQHAISAHAPSYLKFALDGRYRTFRCAVAFNDDTSHRFSYAHFHVRADGTEVACAEYVVPGDPPRELCAEITGARILELVTQTTRWENCHTVWLNPQLDETSNMMSVYTLTDCLERAVMEQLQPLPRAEMCVATVVSPGFEGLLDDMLGSLYTNGGCHDALLLVCCLNADKECERVVAKYNGMMVRCHPLASLTPNSKAVLYSIAQLVDAKMYLCLDADMLVLSDLRPVFTALNALPPDSILCCREGNGQSWRGSSNLSHALQSIYGGYDSSIPGFRNICDSEGDYKLVVNDGLFAGNRFALLALDGVIRSIPGATQWIDERSDIWWRNQYVFNLALAHLRCGVELDPTYNVQLQCSSAEFREEKGRIRARWCGRPARVVHFNGIGRNKNIEWRGQFAKVGTPLVGTGGGDSYAAFLDALRIWVGRHGLEMLAWSFYGTTNANSACVHDPDVFTLLALLHYLVRANGCVRVLETGTARGVSASCLASAVAHHNGARVVTIDPYVYNERESLWAQLPEHIRACIEPRMTGSLEG